MSTIAYTFEATFAGVQLEIETWTEDIGRTVAEYRPERGDGAQLSDRGRVPRVYSLNVRITGDEREAATKRAGLVALAGSGETRVFQHPLDGVVRCKLSEFSGNLAAGDISYQMRLIEDVAFAERFRAQRRQDSTSELDVIVTAEAALETLALLPAPPAPLPDIEGAVTAAASWPERSQDDIIADVEAMRADVRPMVRALDRATDSASYNASVDLEAFRAAYELRARAVNTIRGATFRLTVAAPTPLVTLLAGLYGARHAEAILDEQVRINSVRNPARIPAGFVLALPARG